MKIKKQWVRDKLQNQEILHFFSSSVLKILSQVVTIYITIKALSLEDFGLYSYLILFVSYYAIFNFGTISGMNRYINENFILKRNHIVQNICNTVFTYFFILFVVTLLILFVYISYKFSYDLKMIYGILSMTLLSIFTQSNYYFQSIYLSLNQSKRLSKYQTIYAFLNILSLPIIYIYGFYGLLFKITITELIYSIILFYNLPQKISFRFNKKIFLYLIAFGFPSYILNYIWGFSITIDKLLIKKYMSIEDLGKYNISFYVFTIAYLLVQSLTSYHQIKLISFYSESKDPIKLIKYYLRTTLPIILGAIACCFCGFFIIPILYDFVYNIDSERNIILRITILAVLFMVSSAFFINLIYTIKNFKYITLYTLINSMIFFLVFIGYFYFFKNPNLVGVSYTLTTAYFLIFTHSAFFMLYLYKMNLKNNIV